MQDINREILLQSIEGLPETPRARVKARTDRLRELITMDAEGMIALMVLEAEHCAGELQDERNTDAAFAKFIMECLGSLFKKKEGGDE